MSACACTGACRTGRGCAAQSPLVSWQLVPFHRPPMQEGWVCPKCGSVWSPAMTNCFNCNRPDLKVT